MKVYFAADHAGFELKNVLLNFARGELSLDVEDCGAYEFEPSDDYPDLMASAAGMLSRDVAEGLDTVAVLIGASGQGEAMAANRFRGVRAAVYYGNAAGDQTDAAGHKLDILASTRKHNAANALALGARFLTEQQAKDALRAWILARFEGDERHLRRIQKLDLLQNQSES